MKNAEKEIKKGKNYRDDGAIWNLYLLKWFHGEGPSAMRNKIIGFRHFNFSGGLVFSLGHHSLFFPTYFLLYYAQQCGLAVICFADKGKDQELISGSVKRWFCWLYPHSDSGWYMVIFGSLSYLPGYPNTGYSLIKLYAPSGL